MLLSPPEQEPRNLIQSIFSFDDNVMLAAVICLLIVIFFVLLLHIYGKWFLSQSRSRSRTPVVSVSQVLGPTPFRRVDPFPFHSDYPTKGLDSSVIASIPLFVYEPDQKNQELECVICLGVFKGGELGKKLPKCWHGFHVQCIDMWLGSHSSCPICRAPAAIAGGSEVGEIDSVSNGDVVSDSVNEEGALEIVVEVPNADRESEGGRRSGGDSSVASSLSSQAAAIGESLKRMLSKSRSERKVRPLSNVVNDSDDWER